jgi:hypothetical protein
VGEVHKRLYVNNSAPLLPANRQNIVRAIRAYKDAYQLDRRVLWNGINVVALVHRAAKDGVPIPEDIVPDLLIGDDPAPGCNRGRCSCPEGRFRRHLRSTDIFPLSVAILR